VTKQDARPENAERVDPFANLGNFKPKLGSQPRVIEEDINKISKDNGFPSRQAKPAKRPRFNSSGPKEQLNIKVSRDCHQKFYELARRKNIRVLGDLVALALDALESQDQNSLGSQK